MFGVFGKKKGDRPTSIADIVGMPGAQAPTAEQVAALVKGDPAMREAFERAYAAHDDGMTAIGATLEAARENAAGQYANAALAPEGLIDEIVKDLLAGTRVYSTASGEWGMPFAEEYSRGRGSLEMRTRDAMAIESTATRPQLTGGALVREIDAPSTPVLLMSLARALDESLSERKRQQAYHVFRQGLDLLDLDGGMYEMLLSNPDSIGRWLPALRRAAEGTAFRVPETTVAQVPMPVLQLARIAYEDVNPTTHEIVNRWAQQAFGLEEGGDYFLKTGVFSSKFDFRNARVNDPQEIAEIGDYLLYTHHLALAMAGPLNAVPTYGAGTSAEWAVREFVPADPGAPEIYHGMPLRCELRVFVDCDSDEVLSVVPYWNPETMKNRFSQMADADHPDNRHDMVVYLLAEEELTRRFEELREPVARMVEEMLPGLALEGQWSLDVMSQGKNSDDLWLIDMARAQSSAFYESVPEGLRRPVAPREERLGWIARDPQGLGA